jgi:hypothetical protein
MNTQLEVKIDFVEASTYWNLNKKNTGNGHYVYRCEYVHSNGRICNRPQGLLCKQHKRKKIETLNAAH